MHLRDEDKEFLEPSRAEAAGAQVFGPLEHSDRAQGRRHRRDIESGQGVLDPAEVRTHGRGLSGVLQASDSRLRRRACLGAQQGGRQYRVHLAAVPADTRALRPVRTGPARRRAAVCEARLHHGQSRRIAAALAAFHARAGRYRGFAPQCVARAVAEQSYRREDQVGAGETLARSVRGTCQGQAGGIRGLLENLRRGAEGGRHRRCRPEDSDRQAAALQLDPFRVDPGRGRCAGRDARRLCIADEDRSESHLLSDGGLPVRGAQ